MKVKSYIMKLSVLLFSTVALFSVHVAKADQIALDSEERALIQHLKELELQQNYPEALIVALENALRSPKDPVSTQAMRVIAMHRLHNVWRKQRVQLNWKKGTSAKLARVIDEVFSASTKIGIPLIKLYPSWALREIPKAGEPLRLYGKDGDQPLEDVLLKMAIIDSLKIDRRRREKGESELTNIRFEKFQLSEEQKVLIRTGLH